MGEKGSRHYVYVHSCEPLESNVVQCRILTPSNALVGIFAFL